ncbi:MAG: hypothetical protein NZZ41_02710, partial [Candidatus Dojkabacteria bacterium]|nr:hypothetical protein [Candidatus Dojkabacteria bacterium]
MINKCIDVLHGYSLNFGNVDERVIVDILTQNFDLANFISFKDKNLFSEEEYLNTLLNYTRNIPGIKVEKIENGVRTEVSKQFSSKYTKENVSFFEPTASIVETQQPVVQTKESQPTTIVISDEGFAVKTYDHVPKAEKNKAPFKSRHSVGFIGFGKERSSTDYYAQQYRKNNLPVNPTFYEKGKIYFASINGDASTDQILATFNEIKKALDSGALVFTDSLKYLETSIYNRGEKALREALIGADYAEKEVKENENVTLWYSKKWYPDLNIMFTSTQEPDKPEVKNKQIEEKPTVALYQVDKITPEMLELQKKGEAIVLSEAYEYEEIPMPKPTGVRTEVIKQIINMYLHGKKFVNVDARGAEAWEMLNSDETGIKPEDIYNIKDEISGKLFDFFNSAYEYATGTILVQDRNVVLKRRLKTNSFDNPFKTSKEFLDWLSDDKNTFNIEQKRWIKNNISTFKGKPIYYTANNAQHAVTINELINGEPKKSVDENQLTQRKQQKTELQTTIPVAIQNQLPQVNVNKNALSKLSSESKPLLIGLDGSGSQGNKDGRIGAGVVYSKDGVDYGLSFEFNNETIDTLRAELGITETITTSNGGMELYSLFKALEIFSDVGEHINFVHDNEAMVLWVHNTLLRRTIKKETGTEFTSKSSFDKFWNSLDKAKKEEYLSNVEKIFKVEDALLNKNSYNIKGYFPENQFIKVLS